MKILRKSVFLRSVAVFVALFSLAGVACAERVLLPVKPRDGERRDYCGETCIQEAMVFFGKHVFQADINKAGGGDGVQGLWSDGIEAALRALKVKHEKWRLDSIGYDEYVEMLKQKLDRGYPVLVGVKINPTKHRTWFCDHFILLVGYTDDSFIYNSPTERKERSFLQFRDGDADGSGWTLTNRFNYYFGVAIMGMK